MLYLSSLRLKELGRLPVASVTFAVAVCVIVTVLVLHFVQSQPFYGLQLTIDPEGTGIEVSDGMPGSPTDGVALGKLMMIESASGAALQLQPNDLIEEPDALGRYSAIDSFLTRQQSIYLALQKGGVSFQIQTSEGLVTSGPFYPQNRPLSDLPIPFWIQIFVGTFSFVIGVWVWSLRRQDDGAQMFALVGLSLTMSSIPSAIYGSREIALPEDTFFWLSSLNYAGAVLFGGFMVALFLAYPVKLVERKWLILPVAIALPPIILDILRLANNTAVVRYLPIVLFMAAICLLIGLQYWKSKNQPLPRAALKWFGLSVTVGAGAFVITIALPTLLGFNPVLSQGYAFGFFLLIYVGLALGISRYRLFSLDTWAFRVLFYITAVILLLTLDAALIFLLSIDRLPALAASLFFVALLYLPLRDILMQAITKRRDLASSELLRGVVEIGFSGSGEERSQKWQNLLLKSFDPLEIRTESGNLDSPMIEADGLDLVLPAVLDTPSLRLHCPAQGRKLFSPADLETANQLVSFVRYVEERSNAYNEGAMQERKRIATDLHDDVGATLLSALLEGDLKRVKERVREAMNDTRTIAVGLAGKRLKLSEVLSELRYETSNRLQPAKIDLKWHADLSAWLDLEIDYAVYRDLTLIHREIVSNLIKHAKATQFEARFSKNLDDLTVSYSDDGIGIDLHRKADGSGLRNIRMRAERLQGSFVIHSLAHGGTETFIKFPLVG